MTERKQPSDLERLFGKGLISQGNGEMSAPQTLPDPFDLLESPGAVAAYVFHKGGESALRHLLTADGTTKEWAEDIVAELSAAGLQRAAIIAGECAAQLPSMTDLSFCCYTQEPYASTPGNQANIASWVKSEERRQREREARRHKAKRV